jgi:hypothetical protein
MPTLSKTQQKLNNIVKLLHPADCLAIKSLLLIKVKEEVSGEIIALRKTMENSKSSIQLLMQ